MPLFFLRPAIAGALFLFLAPLTAAPVEPPSAAVRYLQKTLHVSDEVAACVTALNRQISSSTRYDRLVQLDRYVMRAKVRREPSIFSISKPVEVDTIVALKGSARVRHEWAWQPVNTRCGLKDGEVVAVSIEARGAAIPPTAKRRRRPGTGYVDYSVSPGNVAILPAGSSNGLPVSI